MFEDMEQKLGDEVRKYKPPVSNNKISITKLLSKISVSLPIYIYRDRQKHLTVFEMK
jgi:hypothetical protein